VSELTLGGYVAKHERPPAFAGSDGEPYSVGILVDDQPDDRGRYGAALLFIRWSAAGDRPVGHLQTPDLAWGQTPDEARERVGNLSLFDVKAALDEAIAGAPDTW
jgi:hypothetical protein